MPFKPGQSGNPAGRAVGTKIDTYRASLRRLMDRAIATHEVEVEEALVKAATEPKSVLPALELWGRVRREIGPGSADETTGVLNVALVLTQPGNGHAGVSGGRLTLHLDSGDGASE